MQPLPVSKSPRISTPPIPQTGALPLPVHASRFPHRPGPTAGTHESGQRPSYGKTARGCWARLLHAPEALGCATSKLVKGAQPDSRARLCAPHIPRQGHTASKACSRPCPASANPPPSSKGSLQVSSSWVGRPAQPLPAPHVLPSHPALQPERGEESPCLGSPLPLPLTPSLPSVPAVRCPSTHGADGSHAGSIPTGPCRQQHPTGPDKHLGRSSTHQPTSTHAARSPTCMPRLRTHTRVHLGAGPRPVLAHLAGRIPPGAHGAIPGAAAI